MNENVRPADYLLAAHFLFCKNNGKRTIEVMKIRWITESMIKRIFTICFSIICLLTFWTQNTMAGEFVMQTQMERNWMDTTGQFADFHREDLNLYARSAVLTDAATGRILYGKSADTPMANASTTKILTCLLAIESGKLSDTVPFSENACKMPEVKLGCGEESQFILEDLLYSLMLESHNDTAVALAEYLSGSVEAFAEKMNCRAAELGCCNTHFVSPNGLDVTDSVGEHQTTAYDLSLIMAACIRDETFLKITETASKTIQSLDGNFQKTLYNHNALLTMLKGTLSGKTGFTTKAGYCYVGAYCEEDRTYTFALLACGWPNHKGYKWEDSKKLITYAKERYHWKTWVQPSEMQQVTILNGVFPSTNRCGKNLFTDEKSFADVETISVGTDEFREKLLLSDTDEIAVEWKLPKNLPAPVKQGLCVGERIIRLNGKPIFTQPAYALETVEKFDFAWCLRHVFYFAGNFSKFPVK